MLNKKLKKKRMRQMKKMLIYLNRKKRVMTMKVEMMNEKIYNNINIKMINNILYFLFKI